jgi:hypothetical protein
MKGKIQSYKPPEYLHTVQPERGGWYFKDIGTMCKLSKNLLILNISK